ncbi:Retroviral-like aspartic protease 1 [Holothuria leucospilota]|uniref:Retroviral-like aspartic protease 1 n=1 Tax=Holothuria leucospilota TaxID=206669 RepID=A0A9Q1C994_HOLLE|nr:Retroviral-like aspartic protease 1 [Holothuria leucospilota]
MTLCKILPWTSIWSFLTRLPVGSIEEERTRLSLKLASLVGELDSDRDPSLIRRNRTSRTLFRRTPADTVRNRMGLDVEVIQFGQPRKNSTVMFLPRRRLGGNQTDPPSEGRNKSRVTFTSTLEKEQESRNFQKRKYQDSANLRFGRREEHHSESLPSRGIRDPPDLEYLRRGQNHADSVPYQTGTCERETSRRPLMLPESFDGSQPWEDYLTHFESVAEINGWNRKQMARFLGANLKGEALEVFTELSCATRTSFPALVEALERRFGHAHQTPLFRTQLSMRRRGRNESLQQLAQAIKRLVNGAYPSLDMNARDGIAIENFRAALDDAELQRAVFIAKPRTLAEAVTAAVEMESFQQAQMQHSRQQRGILRNVDCCQDNQSQATTDLNTIRKALEEIRGTLAEL